MIGKKVGNAKWGASKASRIGSLLDYIRAPQRLGSDEKCAYYGGRGFLTDSPGGHRAEMVALAQDAARSSDPVNHYILSWREGEVPMPDQVEQAVTLLLHELGLEDHQAAYGLHVDTDNLHLHVAVNRVHPDTLGVVKINGGFDLEALHKAVARIEHAQGWLPEPRARYQINERGEAVTTPRTQDEVRRPAQDKCDREAHTGCRSAERIAIEEAAPIIARATSWKELHAALAEQGMRYERTGSGAKVFVGDTAVKASRVARSASLGKLEERLGTYCAATDEVRVKPTQAQPIRPELPGWQQYNEQREKYFAERREAWKALRAQHDRERQALRDDQCKRRAEVLAGNFTGRGQLLNTLRAALAEEQRSESQAQREGHARAREGLRKQFGRFPGIEQWLRRQGDETRAEQWRYREHAVRAVERRVPAAAQVSSAMYTRFAAESADRQKQRRRAVEHLWSEYGRDVARLKNASKQRWAVVKLVSKGRIAGKLWALSARAADQHAWRQLHERHRTALREAHREHGPLDWTTWLRANAAANERSHAQPRKGRSR